MKKWICMVLILCCVGSMAAAASLREFSATDLQGNPVDQSVFAGYDLTMVNIWATWCGFCVDEMPALAKLHRKLPDNVNLVTICEDAAVEADLAAQILSEAGADFVTIVPSDDMQKTLLKQIHAFPTTVFVNASGKIVGEPIVGVPSLDNPAEAYGTIFRETFESMK